MSSKDAYEELFPQTIEKEDQNVVELKLEIEHLESIRNFSTTPAGKQLLAERETQLFAIINKLFGQLKEPKLEQFISLTIQLKHAIRDLIDFKGVTNSIEVRESILESITKTRGK